MRHAVDLQRIYCTFWIDSANFRHAHAHFSDSAHLRLHVLH